MKDIIRAGLSILGAAALLQISAAYAAERLSDAACNRQARSALDEALKIAKMIPDKDLDGRNSVGNYETLRPGYAPLRGDIAVAYGQAKCWSRSEAAIAAIEVPVMKLEARLHLLQELIRQGILSVAEQRYRLLDSWIMEAFGSGPNCFFCVERAQSKAAISMARGMIKAGRIDDGKVYFDGVGPSLKELLSRSGLDPLENRFFLYVDALAEGGHYAEAVAAIDGARDDMNKFNATLNLAGKLIDNKQVPRARKILDRLIDRLLTSDFISKQLGLLEHALERAVRLYSRMGNVETGMRLMRRIEDPKIRLRALAEIAKNLPKGADFREIAKVAVDINSGCRGDYCRIATLRLVGAFAEKGREKSTNELISKIYEKHTRIHSYAMTAAAAAFARGGYIGKAEQIFLKVRGKKHALEEALGVAYGKSGDFQSALRVFKDTPIAAVQLSIAMTIASTPISSDAIDAWYKAAKDLNESRRSTVYQLLSAALARRGESERAARFVNELAPSLTRARGLLGIAQGHVGIVPGARELDLIAVR